MQSWTSLTSGMERSSCRPPMPASTRTDSLLVARPLVPHPHPSRVSIVSSTTVLAFPA